MICTTKTADFITIFCQMKPLAAAKKPAEIIHSQKFIFWSFSKIPQNPSRATTWLVLLHHSSIFSSAFQLSLFNWKSCCWTVISNTIHGRLDFEQKQASMSQVPFIIQL
jgi:hypothetical protein